MSERIQKYLATLGVASRREIERMIDEGRIIVNGKSATPGQQVDARDTVKIDGKPIAMQRKAEPPRVLVYKKRVGEIVTRDDPEGRRTVFRKLPKLASGRWIAVGRLDINTSGLLLFTNHGELARRLTHPSFEIPRTYAARVLGTVDDAVLARWKSGVELDDGVARFERVEQGGESGLAGEELEGANQWYTVTVREGRNRLVRRLIESQKLQVSRLIRVRYGPIDLGRGIKSGSAREATPAELLALFDATGLDSGELETAAGRRKPVRQAADVAGKREVKPTFERSSRRTARPATAKRDERQDDAPRRDKPSAPRNAGPARSAAPSARPSARPAARPAARPSTRAAAPRKPRPKPTRRG
ncbi:pseudouridine synthase [Solimonas marina]|uniref:Pseudouridine synthase n=1 Tax=Solimonas marina TaxID=2714601 RepID=A0A969WAP9_9GAMM|nr:pseudouridine synthase [Solimonas marina]NKF22669.1 rRNA pseudouridine synthase [Solimonas marina]